MTRRCNRSLGRLLGWLVLAAPAAVSAQTLSLSPAVVPLGGRAGQGVRQTLSLANTTSRTLAFELEARDVVVSGGTRAFVAAGETAGSIAATAVFSAPRLTVAPGATGRVDVTMTIPPAARHRAAVVLFKGTTRLGGDGRTGATVSLGTLFTFALSDAFSVAPSALAVQAQTASSNLAFQQVLANDGTEPVVLKGLAVIVDAAGVLRGRVPFQPHRLLPGESASLRAEYAGELPSGRYRALSTFEFEGRSATRTAEFEVR
ncbi:MAG: hypothetical protein ABW221_03350 [Vicinamibacteria bacterium]